jgi:hypothetical protein
VTPRRLNPPKLVAAAVAIAALVIPAGRSAAGSALRPGPRELVSLAGNAAAATAVRYGVHDDRGNSMDTVKIVQSGRGLYVSVYHTWTAGKFTVKLATSTNVLDWHYIGDLDTDASQPTIRRLPTEGYLVAYEKQSADATRHWLRFRHYAGLADLLSGVYRRQRDVTPALSRIEGTPNIVSIKVAKGLSRSTIAVGLHYNTPAGDREAIGTLTNFRAWSDRPNQALNRRLSALGVHGNLGDRDLETVLGTKLELVEGQTNANDWSSWRVYAYDTSKSALTPVRLHTPGGSLSFGNPTLTPITAPNGRPALVVTYFVFSRGAAADEMGELIFYTALE